MKNNSTKTLLSLVLVFVLMAAAALTGCSGKPAETTAPITPGGAATELGEGAKALEMTIVDKDGNTHAYLIRTDAEMVGQALLEQALIEGENGTYGMYIKSVLGQVLDYEIDGMYWAFYVNGEYAMTGVDTTPITEGTAYLLKAEAA